MPVSIPDSERRTRYTPVVSTTTFAVGFAIVDGDDVDVWHNEELVDPADYDVTLGPLSEGFYSSASVVLDAGVTGTVDIVGARSPRRTETFTEGAGVPASRLNKEAARTALMVREIYDRQLRSLTAPPGTGELLLPPLVAFSILKVSDDGTEIELGPDYRTTVGSPGPTGPTGPTGPQGPTGPAGAGTGDVIGPGTVVDGRAVIFSGTSGTSIAQAAAAPSLVGHTHAQSEITDLVSALAAKLATSTVGVSVQAFGPLLQAIRGLSPTVADRFIYTTGVDTVAVATIAALGRTLLSRSLPADMRSDLTAAARSQTAEALPFIIRTAANETWDEFYPYMPHGGTLTALRFILGAGTLTFQLRKNGVNWGSPLSVTATLQASTGLALTWNAGDTIGFTVSSISGAAQLSVMGTYTRALE